MVNKLKKTLASVALAGATFLGGLEAQAADLYPESKETKAKIVKLADMLEEYDQKAYYVEKARGVLEVQSEIAKILNTEIYWPEFSMRDIRMEKVDEHHPYNALIAKERNERLKKRNKAIDRYLVPGPDGTKKLDLSRCNQIIVGYGYTESPYGIKGEYTIALDCSSKADDGVVLCVFPGGKPKKECCYVTNEAFDTIFGSKCSRVVTINPKEGTFFVTEGKYTSPLMKYNSQKDGKTVPPTLLRREPVND